jgi:hypothetical protein
MNRLLIVAAGTEVITGLALILAPSLVSQLLFAGDLSTTGKALAPLAGFGLLALALACWPDRNYSGYPLHAIRGMLLFSLLCAVYLVYRGGGDTGPLLWPAAAFHATLAVLLARGWLRVPNAARQS